MLFPKCPKCGGQSEAAEKTSYDNGGRHAGRWLHQQAAAGHPHPYIKLANIAMSLGNQIYKRWPGGGQKRCKTCGHEFC